MKSTKNMCAVKRWLTWLTWESTPIKSKNKYVCGKKLVDLVDLGKYSYKVKK